MDNLDDALSQCTAFRSNQSAVQQRAVGMSQPEIARLYGAALQALHENMTIIAQRPIPGDSFWFQASWMLADELAFGYQSLVTAESWVNDFDQLESWDRQGLLASIERAQLTAAKVPSLHRQLPTAGAVCQPTQFDLAENLDFRDEAIRVQIAHVGNQAWMDFVSRDEGRYLKVEHNKFRFFAEHGFYPGLVHFDGVLRQQEALWGISHEVPAPSSLPNESVAAGLVQDYVLLPGPYWANHLPEIHVGAYFVAPVPWDDQAARWTWSMSALTWSEFNSYCK